MIILQLALYCVLFTLMVKIAVGNNALNGLCFYPKPVSEKVYELRPDTSHSYKPGLRS